MALLAAVLPATAEGHRARIRGVVLDPAFAGIPDVEVRATREATADTRRVKTDGRGRFTFPELPPGTYRIVVEQAGYGPFIARAELAMNQEFRLEAALQPGTAVQAVDVTAPFTPVDRESPALHTFVDARQLAALPVDGRNFLELALLAPGVLPAPQRAAGSGRREDAVTVNGAREDFNSFLLDGADNVDPGLNTPGVRPPYAGIREFQVLTSSYDASFGRNAAGQISVVTRSGGSRMTGSAYEFFRDRSLASRNYFAPDAGPAPDYSRHQFGGTLGGPVAGTGGFFFAGYERTRLREGVTQVTTVPTAAERIGDFSQSPLGAPTNPLTGQPFAGGVIPRAVQSPAGRNIAALYPLPNRATPSANYVSSPLRREDRNDLDTRIDQTLRGGAALMIQYGLSDRHLFEPFAGTSLVPGFGTALPRRAQSVSGSFTHSHGRSLVNAIRFGSHRVSSTASPENAGLDNSSVGLPAFPGGARDAGLSLISIAGFSPLGHDDPTPGSSTSNTVHLSDTATWTRGTHIFKAGGEWYGIHQKESSDVLSRGFLTFRDQGYTGSALADALLGLPTLTGGGRFDNPRNLRAQSWGAFAQDDWRALPALTISAGVRYDVMGPPVDAGDRAAVYDPSARTLVRAGTAGIPRGGYAPDRNNVSPRAGFAWTLDAEQHNVLRAGYGIYYNQGTLAASQGLYLNPPYFDVRLFAPEQPLPLTLADPFPASYPVVVPPSAVAYQRDLATSWMEHWNLNIQHEIGQTRSLEVAYAGSRGHNLLSARDVNQAPRDGPRPDPAFADITLVESRASSRYRALQVRYQERPAHGMSLLVSYTLGKSTDDGSGLFATAGDPNYPQNSLDPGAERGRSAFDVRHGLSLGVLRQLPIGTGQSVLGNRGWLSAALADMEVAAVVTMQTGRPFTVLLRPDAGNLNIGRSILGFGAGARPNVSGDTSVKTATADQWFNTAAFSMPPPGTPGNSGRNTLEGPGYRNVNVAIIKRMPFGRQGTLELRAEVFNVFDRVNYDLPDPFFGSPTFGRILSARSPRRMQLGIQAGF
jgi:hypothetical protein